MPGTPVRKRRRELQAQGLSYQDAHRTAVAEHKARTGRDIAPSPVWMPDDNTRQVTHGATVGHIVSDAMAKFVDLIESDSGCAYLTRTPAFKPQVQRWAMAEAKVALYNEWLDKQESIVDGDGTARAENQLAHWMRVAERAADSLGLTPMSRAKMASNFADMMKINVTQDDGQRNGELDSIVAEILGGGNMLIHQLDNDERKRMMNFDHDNNR
jgi:hypothetical protein